MEAIETKRLILRPFKESDYDDLFELLHQLKDDPFEGYPDLTYESCRENLAQRLGSDEFYAVEWKETGKVIGNIFFGNLPYQTREAGYIIREEYRRKGCALEALDAITEQAFRHGVHRVTARCDIHNDASWKLLEKAGFTREAHFRQNTFTQKDGAGRPIWRDTYVYGKLASDF